MLAALARYAPRATTDMRVALRVETHTVGTAERLLDVVRRHRVSLVLFGDRLPEAGLMGPARLAAHAAALGVSPEEHAARLRGAMARGAEVPRHLLRLAEAFDSMGVVFGSEGDRDAEAREAWSMRGARLCAFPAGRSAAASARVVGDPVILRAPEVAGFAARPSRPAASEMIGTGIGAALASDCDYSALTQAAFGLADEGTLSLGRAWTLISEAPSAALRLRDRGRIAPGLRADLCVVDPATRAVEATLCGGRVSFMAGAVAGRFVAASAAARAAA